jgi:hypothetical protein
MQLSAISIQKRIRADAKNCFGIEWEGDRLVRDLQEPRPGFLEAWRTRQARD